MSKSTQVIQTAFTGQPLVSPDRDPTLVRCAQCDSDVLITLNGTGWFDSYNKNFSPTGAYVHFKCLSEKRKAEISSSTLKVMRDLL